MIFAFIARKISWLYNFIFKILPLQSGQKWWYGWASKLEVKSLIFYERWYYSKRCQKWTIAGFILFYILMTSPLARGPESWYRQCQTNVMWLDKVRFKGTNNKTYYEKSKDVLFCFWTFGSLSRNKNTLPNKYLTHCLMCIV